MEKLNFTHMWPELCHILCNIPSLCIRNIGRPILLEICLRFHSLLVIVVHKSHYHVDLDILLNCFFGIVFKKLVRVFCL